MGNSAVVCPWIKSLPGCVTCKVRSSQDVLHLTGRSGVEIREWVFGFMHVVMMFLGIAASSISGAGETCVVCHCS